MAKEFSSLTAKSLWQKLNSESTAKEKKQTRIVLLFLFGLTVFLITAAILARQLPSFWQQFNQPSVVVSQHFVPLPTATPTPKLERERQEIMNMIEQLRGRYGIFFQDLESNDSFEIAGQETFTAASLIKLPVLLTLYREAEAGRINLDEVYKLRNYDKVSGAGSLQYKPAGFEITFRQMAELMGQQSDNTAFNIVSQRLGETKIQELIDALGMTKTSFAKNETSPADIGLLFRKLYKEGIVYEKDKEEILGFLTNTIWEDRIPAGVPKGIKVSHKIGTEVGVISDAGIVFAPRPFILVIMSQGANEIEAKKALPEITRKIYDLVINGN
ncbi:MAG: serine hydrolase [Microgenomates group bacterium]